MPDTKVRQNTFDIFPYDFVKENQVIANKTEDGYEVISPNKISPNLYHEIYKFLNFVLLFLSTFLIFYYCRTQVYTYLFLVDLVFC